MKNANQTIPASQSARSWFLASRPKTWIASLSPVLIGSAMVEGPFHWGLFALAILFALGMQITANLANDYFDFIKGADTAQRQGPTRAVQAGLIAPQTMLQASLGAFSLALAIALPLLWKASFAFLPLALAAILCGFFYTGGKKPLGYLGLGEVLVFFFYGPVAVCGTALVLVGEIPASALFASIIPGALSCAILCANNLRDADLDRAAGKMTLIARFGKQFGQIEYALCLALSILCAGRWAILLALLSIPPLSIVFKEQEQIGKVLPLTARLLMIYTVLFVIETLFL